MRLTALFSLFWLSCLVGSLHSQCNSHIEGADFEPVTQIPLEQLPSPRIVGGWNAVLGQFPYQVSLRDGGQHICGGSIISPNYIATAAHCISTKQGGRAVVKSASRLSIRAGTVLINSGGVVARVAEVKMHPQYTNFVNDIALLRLATPLQFSNALHSIPLAERNAPVGSLVFISGWGRLRGGGSIPTNMQYNALRTISNAECRSLIGSVPTSILCLAHRTGDGACQGDSGGPGVYNNTLVGVTNFVISNCGTSAPDGYANVPSFLTWLRQNSDVDQYSNQY